MSIRLRFTLLYTFILAITLALFGFTLYQIQAQNTLDSLEQDLRQASERFRTAVFRIALEGVRPTAPPPLPFGEFSDERVFQQFREREIIRLLDVNGALVTSPFGRDEDALPITEEGLANLQAGEDWWDQAAFNDEEMLIYSNPILVDGEVVYIIQVARPLTERNRTLQSMAVNFSLTSLGTIVTAFVFGWVLSGITLSPINHITQTAAEIRADRDFDRRVPYSGPDDEVGELAGTINGMLSSLHDAYVELEQALEQQRNFVADVSHELRTPLTTLRGNLELLNRVPPTPPEEQADILIDMIAESDRLIRLVNELLQFAYAEANRELGSEPLDLTRVLKDATQQVLLIAPEREILMDVRAPVMVEGDADALKQILLIGLENALNHSEGDVKMQAISRGGMVEVRIRDRGSGIPAEELEMIFDRFYQGRGGNRDIGFGLGLAIAKTLVMKQGGEIRMESEVGIGSTLVIQLVEA